MIKGGPTWTRKEYLRWARRSLGGTWRWWVIKP